MWIYYLIWLSEHHIPGMIGRGYASLVNVQYVWALREQIEKGKAKNFYALIGWKLNCVLWTVCLAVFLCCCPHFRRIAVCGDAFWDMKHLIFNTQHRKSVRQKLGGISIETWLGFSSRLNAFHHLNNLFNVRFACVLPLFANCHPNCWN